MLRPGTRVDRYELLCSIGAGGMATVYAARHVELGTLHGVKVMSLTSPALVSRVLQEGRIQAGLRHPNIVPVTDVLRIQGVPALVMDLVIGPSLETLLMARRLEIFQVDSLARGILAGVAAAHSQGRVHRDIKPGNVLLELTHEGVVPRVADFGLAKITGKDSMSRSRTGVVMGTPAFMAPEQFRNAKGVGPQADVFSLGVLLYQMLTGELPFPGNDLISIFQAIEAQGFIPPDKAVPGLPRAMNDAIVAALSFKAEDRPSNASELAALWMDLRPEPLQPFSPAEIAGLRSMGVRLPGSIPPVEEVEGSGLFGALSDQRDLVDLAEGSLWPTSLGGAPRTLAPEEEVPAPPLSALSIPPAPAPEGRSWGLVVVVALVLMGAAGWILRGQALKSGELASASPVVEDVGGPALPEGAEVPAEKAPHEPEPEPEPETEPETEPEAVVQAEAPEVRQPVVAEVEPQVPASTTPAPKAPAKLAQVRLSGVDRGYAVNSAGEQKPLKGLEPGQYTIYAFFEAARATKVLELSLAEGQSVSLSCQSAMRMCKPG